MGGSIDLKLNNLSVKLELSAAVNFMNDIGALC